MKHLFIFDLAFFSMINDFLNFQGDFSYSGMGEKTHSTDFSSGKSDSKYYGVLMIFYFLL